MNQATSRRNIRAWSWSAAAIGAGLVWLFFFGYLFQAPNPAEFVIGGGAGIAVLILIRRIVHSEMESRSAHLFK